MCSERKHLIFDFDGTIANTLQTSLQIYNQLSSKYNYTPKDYSELQDMNAIDLIKDASLNLRTTYKAVREGSRLLKESIDSIEPIRGITAVLERLEPHYSMSILTSNIKENVLRFFSNHNIRCFGSIHTSRKVFSKHRYLRQLLRRLRLRKEECVYIGDEVRDIEAAKKINLSIIAVGWGYNSRRALQAKAPDHLVAEPDELLQLLKKDNARQALSS